MNDCPEKERRLASFQQAANAYAKAVDETAAKLETLQVFEVQQLKFIGRLVEHARFRLEQHMAEHQC